MDSCVICDLVNGQKPCRIVCEISATICFLPLDMNAYGHTIIAPKAHFADLYDIPEDVKARRLAEIFKKQQEDSLACLEEFVGKTVKVLIEGFSKRSKEFQSGRTSQNKVVIFAREGRRIGETIEVKISRASSATLFGDVVAS